MVINEQVSSNSIKTLTEAADLQQDIVSQSIKTEVVLQRAEIASRDLRMARNPAEVGKFVDELQKISGDGHKKLSALEAQMVNPLNRDRFKSIGELFKNISSPSATSARSKAKILSLFGDLEQIEVKWTRSVNSVVNSSPFANLSNYMEVESFINEAVSAFKDARTAAWRFFVLHEELQSRRISASADQATEKLKYARRTLTDKANIAEIDALLAIVPEFTDILKATTDTINLQNRISERTGDPGGARNAQIAGRGHRDGEQAQRGGDERS